MSKVLVTGGAGFIGSHLVKALIDNGHDVVVIDNLSTGKKENINNLSKFYNKDILLDISEIFKKEKFDVVFHEAAQMNVRRSISDPVFDSRINIGGTINILENCRHYGVKKIIFASSGGAVYGDTTTIPTPETHKLCPLSPYGVSKVAAENYLAFYERLYNIKYVCLRYGNVYGPGQNPAGEAGVVAIFTDLLLEGTQPTIFGDGSKTRDFVYVSDVVDATIACLKANKIGVFNVGTSRETSILEIYETLKNIIKIEGKPIIAPNQPGEQKISCISNQKIKKDFGWEPKIDILNGLEKTVNFLRKKVE